MENVRCTDQSSGVWGGNWGWKCSDEIKKMMVTVIVEE